MDGQNREIQFEGLSFPIWSVVDRAIEQTHGQLFATHCLVNQAGDRDVPLFRQEEYALTYIAHRNLTGYEPATISTVLELLALLESFPASDGSYVRFDDVYGPTPGTITYPLEGIIQLIHDQLAEG